MGSQDMGRHEQTRVTCPECGKEFDSFRGLNGHANAHRGPIQDRKRDHGSRDR